MKTRSLASHLAALLLAAPALAQTPLTYELVAEGLLDPLAVGAPLGDSRVFVGEHGGLIRVVKNGVVLPTPYLDLQAKVAPPPAGEAGFLGFAFHPDYAENGYVYVHYTDVNFDTVIERYQASAANPDVADPLSGSLVLFVAQPSAYHNGGAIQFGPDGYLYLGLGDGGAGLTSSCPAQDTATVLGKILRLDVDSAQPYAIPPTNPFFGMPGEAQEIWHYGIRNPWRMTLDPATGDLYFGDVGAMTWEELDYAPGGVGGLNFGWPLNEADACFAFHSCASPPFPACNDPAFTPPIWKASHAEATLPCAIIGGEVYRGCALPELQGRYFFTDYCDTRIRSFLYDPVLGVTDERDHTQELSEFFPQSKFITSFGTDGFGELLYVYQATLDLDGKVYRMVPAQTPAGLVDCDGDGFDDACEIAKDDAADLSLDGVLDACQGLDAETAAISVSAGGVQPMNLHAGAAYAGRIYLLSGSLTGTAGIPVSGVTIPLTLDSYTLFGIVHPNTPPLENNLGVLDAAGAAAAGFSSPGATIPAALVGATAYHAYALVHPSGAVVYASNFVSLGFMP